MKRHRLDLFSLIAGLLVVAIAVAALTGVWFRAAAAWLWPGVLIGGGLVVLVAVLLGHSRDEDPTDG